MKNAAITPNSIFNECCLSTMSRMADKSIDIVITSPPYNMNLRIRNGKYCSRQITKEFSTKYEGEFSDNLPIEEFYEFHKKVLSELNRVAKLIFYNISIVTGSKQAFFRLIGDFSYHIKDVVVWDKVNSQPSMQSGVLNQQSELLLVMGDNPISRQFSSANFERGTLSDVWEIKKERSAASGHGATFPTALVRKILSNFSKEGDLVYDPFAGSGTTCVVAKEIGRNYIGSELSEKYEQIAKERLGNAIDKFIELN